MQYGGGPDDFTEDTWRKASIIYPGELRDTMI